MQLKVTGSMSGLLGTNEIDVTFKTPSPEPVVVIAAEEAETGAGGFNAVRVDVVGPTGEIARFWVTAHVRRGRPTMKMTTKPDRYCRKQVSKKLQGTFNIL